MTESTLLGKWHIVYSEAENATCSDLTSSHEGPEAMVNSDKSLPTFEFSNQTKESLTGPKSIFSVQLLNLGTERANQGPYRVDAFEPQFSQYAYSSRSGALTSDGWISYRCRGVENRSDLMICSLRSNHAESAKRRLAEEAIACAQQDTAAFYILKRN
jgi:hypothetical protein